MFVYFSCIERGLDVSYPLYKHHFVQEMLLSFTKDQKSVFSVSLLIKLEFLLSAKHVKFNILTTPVKMSAAIGYGQVCIILIPWNISFADVLLSWKPWMWDGAWEVALICPLCPLKEHAQCTISNQTYAGSSGHHSSNSSWYSVLLYQRIVWKRNVM